MEVEKEVNVVCPFCHKDFDVDVTIEVEPEDYVNDYD